ncbi:MAG: serine/threonine-protein kinase [Victivallaceae bacterium]|jgi:serine/threonine protein kinase
MENKEDSQADSLNEKTSFQNLKVVGDYTLIKPIGIGGMGEVFLAEQKSMQRIVALKILLPALVNNKSSLERFFREVRTLAKIEHPNIAQAIEAGIEDDICYFSMMYIKGEDLSSVIKRKKKLDEVSALKIIRDIAATLDYAWQKHKLIHRDVKPSNIMLTSEGTVKLLDLGISKIYGIDEEELTQRGVMVGSPYYVSPEQAKGEEVDFHADMYSLGATFYQMVTGQPPFDAETTLGIVSRHLCDPVPDPRMINENISERTALLIMKMLEKKRYDRFSDWQKVINECNDIIAEKEILNAPAARQAGLKKPGFALRCMAIPPRLQRLLFTLLIMIIALAVLINYSNKENARKEKEKSFVNAIAFAKSCSSDQYQDAFAKLEYVIRNAPAEYAGPAKELLNTLNDKIIEDKRVDEKHKIEAAVLSLRQKSYTLEQQGKFQQAIELWQFHLQNSPWRGNQTFRDQVDKMISLIKEERSQKEKKHLD